MVGTFPNIGKAEMLKREGRPSTLDVFLLQFFDHRSALDSAKKGIFDRMETDFVWNM